MRFIVLALLFLIFTASVAVAQTAITGRSLVVNLAADHVDISIGFNGADITLSGVKNRPGQLAVIVRGPEQTTVVRRKTKTLGVWMNTHSVEFLNVPVYYDFAVSVPERELAAPEVLRKYNIGLDALDIRVEKNEDPQTLDSFKEALVRNQQAGGHFPLSPKPVKFISDDFFRIDFHVPADVPTGTYIVETILFDNGAVIDRRETRLRVAQVGFSADVHNFAYDNGFLYGLLAIGLALVSGASAHFFFRRTA
jgi:uncharacterized protein (TIGR02186 family)